jgi:acetyl-CoA synthetase
MSSTITSLGGYIHEYQKSILNPAQFWEQIAEEFFWRKRWDVALSHDFSEPRVEWFRGGKLNIVENCLDRHLFTRGDQPAIIFEPNNGTGAAPEPSRTLTYRQLHTEVCRATQALARLGVRHGDRVAIYLPLIPEAIIAMLACARLGAVHSVVFGGFSPQALRERTNDCGARVLITADGAYRGEKEVALKAAADEALLGCPEVTDVLVVRRTGAAISMMKGEQGHRRDHWWHEALDSSESTHEAVATDAEDMLFVLYTSGSTGKPKGVVHTVGGYMVYTAYTFQNVFQCRSGHGSGGSGERDIFWCTADVGWITGHSYVTYGPLLAGSTILIYEGIPTYPHPGRYWEIIDKHHVTHFYTAPTAIRALQALGNDHIEPYHLSSLRVLGSVGEPLNEDAWHWYHHHIGKERCPVVDTWWQTETGGIMIAPLAGITPTKPAHVTLPLPGVQPVIVDTTGKELTGNSVEGNLCIRFPWPGMLRTTFGDHERCRQSYFSQYPGLYFTGDGAKRDENGYIRILGRVDDVINVSGHRLGTAEIENAINEHPKVLESAVVGYPHPIKGEGIYAYAIVDLTDRSEENLSREIKETVARIIGAIARPEVVLLVPGLPKTRSGKIMRRILRSIASGATTNFGDTSTLINPEIVEQIVAAVALHKGKIEHAKSGG